MVERLKDIDINAIRASVNLVVLSNWIPSIFCPVGSGGLCDLEKVDIISIAIVWIRSLISGKGKLHSERPNGIDNGLCNGLIVHKHCLAAERHA